jgi:short-subunit dehydrogenase
MAPTTKQNIPIVVITGASSGIGAATALACASDGMTVVLAARRAGPLEEVAAQCRHAGGKALVIPTDVRLRSDVEALVARTVETFGQIDVLIANAGIGFHEALVDATDDQLREIIDINVLGVMRCARAVVPHMITRGSGHVITVSSVAVGLMWPNDSVYAATKAAVHRFAKGLRNELRLFGVAVTDVIPGVIETPLTERLDGVRKADARIVAAAIVRAIMTRPAEVVTPRVYRFLLWLNAAVRESVNRWIAFRAPRD